MSAQNAVELLDQLNALRAADITPLPWKANPQSFWRVEDRLADMVPEDAALIVGAVNALPQLTAALRAALLLADQWDALDMGTGRYPEDSTHRSAQEDRAQVCAAQLREAITNALRAAADQAEAEQA